MENINLSIQTVNAVLSYLGSRPYVEVSSLITAIQKEAESQAKPAEAKNEWKMDSESNQS
mgnify:CR=1 FL=1